MLGELWNSTSPGDRLYIIVMISYIPLLIFTVIASYGINRNFSKYSKVRLSCGLTANQIAREILQKNNVACDIAQIGGNLTDNFNPKTSTVSLSQTVYGSTSVAAAGVACHEVGHAIQHDQKTLLITLRTALVPVVNFSNRLLGPLVIIGCIFGLFTTVGFLGDLFLYAGLILFGFSLLFSLVTLPVELDASRRALVALRDGGYVTGSEIGMAKKVLKSAAMTYLAGLLMSTWQFLRFFAIFLSRRD